MEKELIKIGSLVKVDEYEHLMECEGHLYPAFNSTEPTEICLIDNHSYSYDEVIEVWNKMDEDTYKCQYRRNDR